MPGRLARNPELFEVPGDLTYFVHDEDRLVINPEVGARCILTPAEFGVLRELVADRVEGRPAVFPDGPAAERALAKLVLNWIVYYNGHKPRVRVEEPPLYFAYYAITDGCNLRCPYCYASSEKCKPNELNTAESLNLMDQIAAMGGHTVVFTGGEPMLRKDLFQIAEYADSLGLKSRIITNATMIRTPEQARRFAEVFEGVTVSMDGGTAESHDRTRGKGSFARTHKALLLLNEAGVEPAINHIVTSDNIDELEDFAAFIAGIRNSGVRLMNHSFLGRGTEDGMDFGWRDHLRIQEIVWTSPVASELRPDGPRPINPCTIKGNCGMGGNEIYIDSLGDVYPCKLITGKGEYAGNVRRTPLAEIFRGPVLTPMRRSTVYGGEFHEDCAKCYIRANCGGGCRASHMSESGDPRRNSRLLCRQLRHGVTTQLWNEQGVSRAELAAKHETMAVPRLVTTDEVHEVFDQWKTYTPTPRHAVKVGELLSITPVSRRSEVVPSDK